MNVEKIKNKCLALPGTNLASMEDLTNAIASLAVAEATDTDLDKKGEAFVNCKKHLKFNYMFFTYKEWPAMYHSWTKTVVFGEFV